MSDNTFGKRAPSLPSAWPGLVGPQDSGWVDTAKRFPPEGRRVLICYYAFNDPHRERLYAVANFSGGAWLDLDDDEPPISQFYEPTHWMELPPLPVNGSAATTSPHETEPCTQGTTGGQDNGS